MQETRKRKDKRVLGSARRVLGSAGVGRFFMSNPGKVLRGILLLLNPSHHSPFTHTHSHMAQRALDDIQRRVADNWRDLQQQQQRADKLVAQKDRGRQC